MTASDFEQELQQIDARFTIVDNPTRPGLSNIFFEGRNFDLPAISTFDIREEADPSYIYEFPNGLRSRFWSRPEILGRITQFLEKINSETYKDNFKEDEA